jgi:molybdenum cofactor cytidylyltransferase
MRLADALRMSPLRVVAFTGAGGKSTAIACVVREVSSEHPLVVTTTTKLHFDQSSMAESHLVIQGENAFNHLPMLLSKHSSVLVTGDPIEGESKWSGLASNMMDELAYITKREGVGLLVEADGARGRSLKAPLEHEPAIPSCVDMVVPVVGLDVIGEVLSEEWVHRPSRVGSLLGLTMGERLEPRHVAALLRDPMGGLKDVPEGVEIRFLFNKAEDPERVNNGRVIAEELIALPHVSAGILGCVAHEPPVSEVIGRVAGVVLAAGDSKRLGQPKQLITWKDRPLVLHAVHAALGGGLSPVIVVLGAEGERVRRVLEDEPVTFVNNPAWLSGLSTSLRAGLSAIEDRVEAVVFLLSDMPFVNEDLVRVLVDKHRQTLSPLVTPRVGSRRANPILFDQITFSALRAVTGDRGGRELIQKFPHVWVEWDDSILFDLDTPEDLRWLKGQE